VQIFPVFYWYIVLKGAIHTKKVKQNVKNSFREPKNVNCAYSVFTVKPILGADFFPYFIGV